MVISPDIFCSHKIHPTTWLFKGFCPTNILSLRTLKADVVAGLDEGQAEHLSAEDKDWMINGNWGVIQFASSPN